MFFAFVLPLVAAVVVLSVRLYQTTRRLDKAEQYMMSGMVSWVGVCGAIATDLGSPYPGRARVAADLLKNQCLSPHDWPTFDALLAKGEYREALSFISDRLYGHRLPLILKRGSYDSSSFPVGYP